jgi:hypothetical protein
MRKLLPLAAAAFLGALVPAAHAAPQLRVSPGPLSKAHANLEGVAACGKCHEPGAGPASARCLACHAPVAARMAAHRGVHREVTGECGKCHREHAGLDADIRRLDPRTFNHAVETGFALEGAHLRAATTCTPCHKKRSFQAVSTACASCHPDPHKPSLGPDCARCHSATLAFKQTRARFEHSRTAFVLTGAHREVPCEKCHTAGIFRGLHFDACTGCHATPHRKPLGPTCTTCHVTDRWSARPQPFDHARTDFALAGAHASVACAKCHAGGIKKVLQHDRCAACHENPHRESIRDDCRKCHTESGFRTATFDHVARSPFPMSGGHTGLACRKCHTRLGPGDAPASAEPAAPPRPAGAPRTRAVVDFGGLKPACIGCHKDQHKGEFGQACDGCHRTATFKAAGFTHPRAAEFFAGRHAGVACVKCHVRPGAAAAKPPSMACARCHADPHLGQVGGDCERCHAIDAAKFAPVKFSHATGRFPLTGKHGPLPCAKCHPSQTAAFPAGTGTATRLAPLSPECASCHKDPHLGQVDARCASCHATETFKLASYTHSGLDSVFGVATHSRLPCKSCHKTETGQFPAGRGTALRLKVGRTCLECHP